MSEELTRLEKLERRKQQLEKWKLKKAAAEKAEKEPICEDASNHVTQNPPPAEVKQDAPVSAEELKKIERQRKLEEWKRKKQQQASANGPAGNSLAPQPEPSHTSLQVDGALPDVNPQNRLTAWKQDRATGNNSPAKLATVKAIPRKRTIAKANVFGGDDDEDGTKRPVFRAPSGPKHNYNRTGEGSAAKKAKTENSGAQDEVDAFLAALEADETAGHVTPANTGESAGFDESDSELSASEEDKLISAQMKSFVRGKELAQIDHASVQYAPFKKAFYAESPAVAALSEEEVKMLRLEMDAIKVSGQNVPRPIWEWDQLGVSPMVLAIMQDKLGYPKPTAIQAQALPAVMSGRDFLGVAKTGSGKTLAFVLPLLGHVTAQPPLTKNDGPVAVLLAPTRELALQIFKQLSHFTKRLGISACCCCGGSSIEPQIADLKKGSQVVVATPGRLIDLLAANGGRVCNLQRVTYIVLDEADRMFDIGFEPQVNKIFSQIRPDRQSILFSATFAKKMESLARAVLRDPVEVVVGGISVVAPEISQKIVLFEVGVSHTSDAEVNLRKFRQLTETLADAKYAAAKKLVFVEKQDAADALLVKLLAHNVPCVAVHGGKEQIDRQYAVREFSSPDSGVDVLIATSVAARGLDVKGLDLVVNFDPANHMEDYVHRVGRTGRAGRKGDAVTFVTSVQERPIADLVKALRLSQVPDSDIDPRLLAIAEAFLEKVRSGKEKFRFGFGGNGLHKLDESRTSAKSMERKAYDAGPQGVKQAKAASMQEPDGRGLELPEFRVIEGRAEETSGPDKCKFHSRVTINDLPQKARWTVVNADSLASIIEATSTSITNKGQYYAPGTKIPTTVKQGGAVVPAPPKLYLLIEGLTESAVSDANHMIRQKMIEGLEQAKSNEGSAAPGRYKV